MEIAFLADKLLTVACTIGDVDKYFYVLPFHKHLEMGSQHSGVLISFIPIIFIAGLGSAPSSFIPRVRFN